MSFLPADKQNLGRHFDLTLKDFNNHVDEIYSKLVSVVDQHLLSGLSQWTLTSGIPSTAFQHVIKQIGKFYNGFSSVMPAKETTVRSNTIVIDFGIVGGSSRSSGCSSSNSSITVRALFNEILKCKKKFSL